MQASNVVWIHLLNIYFYLYWIMKLLILLAICFIQVIAAPVDVDSSNAVEARQANQGGQCPNNDIEVLSTVSQSFPAICAHPQKGTYMKSLSILSTWIVYQNLWSSKQCWWYMYCKGSSYFILPPKLTIVWETEKPLCKCKLSILNWSFRRVEESIRKLSVWSLRWLDMAWHGMYGGWMYRTFWSI